jgi:hypothetical protein
MTESEKFQLEAEEKGRLARKQQDEIDLRARQIDKLHQEIDFYEHEMLKYEREQQDLFNRASQAAAQEHDDEKRRQRQHAIDAARSLAHNN